MPDEIRSKWLRQFLLSEQLRRLRFQRAVMPEDAEDTKLRLVTKVDAARLLTQGCWGGFKRKTGGWSCQNMLSRNLLASRDSTTQKDELQVFTNGSNMSWLVRKMLDEWVEDYIVCGDSVITLCWISSERKSLSMYHRNRVIQVRRAVDLDKLYHVATEENLADTRTPPDRVKLEDVGPDSEWELGKPWMRGDISDTIEHGILKPISHLRIYLKKILTSIKMD